MEGDVQLSGAQMAVEVAGNRFRFYPEGPARFDALVALIDGASESLRLLYYTFKDDHAGHRVVQALLAARARGVEVSLLIDGFGSEDVPDAFFTQLVDGGCRFCRFEPLWGRRYLLRNHQKFALADSQSVLAGGFNVADDYFGTPGDGAWRDMGFQVDGPLAAPLGAFFDELYDWSRSSHRQFRRLRRLLERHSRKEGQCRWLFGGPTRRLNAWARTIKSDMMRAGRLDMIAAYFSPNRAMLRRISGIARRGQSRLVTAAKSDNGATIGAARHTYARLLRGDVDIYEYQPTKLHTKLVIVDDVVHIGSANFDMRSLYLNLEIMLRIEDKTLAAMLRRYVDGEMLDCVKVTVAEHMKRRTWFNRMKWALCYFVVATTDYTVTRRLNFGMHTR